MSRTEMTEQERIDQLVKTFRQLAGKAEDEGLESEERERLLKLALTLATDELYRIEEEHGGAAEDTAEEMEDVEETMMVDPRILTTIREIGIILQEDANLAEQSNILTPDGLEDRVSR